MDNKQKFLKMWSLTKDIKGLKKKVYTTQSQQLITYILKHLDTYSNEGKLIDIMDDIVFHSMQYEREIKQIVMKIRKL